MIEAAQITIGVTHVKDGNYQIGLAFVGDENKLIPLLGAMSQAEQWVKDRISKRIGEGTWGYVDGAQPPPEQDNSSPLGGDEALQYSSEQKVSREKAIEATEYAIKSLQLRVETMKQSPDSATFLINPELLSKL